MSQILEQYLKEKLPFLDALNKYISPKDMKVIFEVGGCEAEDTIKLSKAFKNAHIYSFEPLPKNVAKAKSNIDKYKASRVTQHQLAMSNRDGESKFYVSSGAPEDLSNDSEWDYGNKSSSLLQPQAKRDHYKWLDFKTEISVTTTRIDTFCKQNEVENIDFLHIDVQGAELMVLEGAGDYINKVAAVWLEVEAIEIYKSQPLEKDIDSFMIKNGFTCVYSTVGRVTGDKLFVANRILSKMWHKNNKETQTSLLNNSPKVSVLMSVYNSEEFIHEAIESILNQTYSNFEFIIINDGSKDKSLRIINSFKDPRIRLINRENWGLTASLNQGISIARGQYIARQDSDDVSVKHRFQKEVEFLDNNPNVGLVGSNYTVMNTAGKKLTTTNVFTHPIDLRLTEVTCNQFGHGSTMMRKAIARKCGGYDSTVGHVEDYHLWTKISRVSDIANIEEPLYLYRSNPEGISQQNLNLQIQQTFAVRDASFKHLLKNRRKYRFLFYKPSGTNYKKRKAVLYRDLAYLYRANDMPVRAMSTILLSVFLDPKNNKNYKFMQYILYKPRFDRWEYEFL